LHFIDLFDTALVEDGHGRSKRTPIMSISSVSPSPAPTPVASADTGDAKPSVAATTASDNGDYQPPPKAPLPPGQGTRVDQLV
jgi:hypothetical protein